MIKILIFGILFFEFLSRFFTSFKNLNSLDFENNIFLQNNKQIKHGALEKVCPLHNGIFYPIQPCHTLSILLHYFPYVIH